MQVNPQVSERRVVRLTRRAMGCRFEVILCGGDEGYLWSAAEEALDEVERLERRLSRFLPGSDVSEINAYAPERPVQVEPGLFSLLNRAEELRKATGGAFDVAVGGLVDAHPMSVLDSRPWGSQFVLLDRSTRSVRFLTEGILLDLGALGKGYAVKCAAALVEEKGIANGFLHGGGSSLFALGSTPEGQPWRVGLPDPGDESKRAAIVSLKDMAMSVSGSMPTEGPSARRCLFDPRTGKPLQGTQVAAAIGRDAADTDALATAFLVLGREEVSCYCTEHHEVAAVLLSAEGGLTRVEQFGEVEGVSVKVTEGQEVLSADQVVEVLSCG